MSKKFGSRIASECGAQLIEYLYMLGFVIIVAVIALPNFGLTMTGAVCQVYGSVASDGISAGEFVSSTKTCFVQIVDAGGSGSTATVGVPF